MSPGHNQGEVDRDDDTSADDIEQDDDTPAEENPTPQELLHVIENNRRYLGPGWLHETLVYLAGIHRRDDF